MMQNQNKRIHEKDHGLCLPFVVLIVTFVGPGTALARAVHRCMQKRTSGTYLPRKVSEQSANYPSLLAFPKADFQPGCFDLPPADVLQDLQRQLPLLASLTSADDRVVGDHLSSNQFGCVGPKIALKVHLIHMCIDYIYMYIYMHK